MRILFLVASFLSSMASAMDIDVDQNFKCESRSIKAKFSYLCNPDGICGLQGNNIYIEGELIYYGLQDVYGAANGDYLVMDAHANINMLAGYTHHQTLIDMHPVPLCGDGYVADQDNNHGNCPADGTYSFVTSFQAEQPEWYDWAMTGFKGDLVLDMYLNSTMQLVGRCKAEMKTVSRGIAPSAKHVSVICLLAASVYVLYTILRYTRPQWITRLRRFRLRDIHHLLDPDEKRNNWVSVTRETVPPYKRKDNSWSTEQLVMA